MFERSRVDTSHQETTISVELVLQDETLITGRLVVPMSRHPLDTLNSPAPFIDVIPYEGDRILLAKSTLKSLRFLNPPRSASLDDRLRQREGFDPHQVLGVSASTPWSEIKAAFHALSLTYHPDRYANADLPREVTDYLAAMVRRINTAFQALERSRTGAARGRPRKAEPIYESGRPAARSSPAAAATPGAARDASSVRS